MRSHVFLAYANNRTSLRHVMFPSSLDALFQNVGVPYGMLLPVAVVALLALVALAGIMRGGNPWEIAYATYCYFAEAVGVILITTGSLPVLLAVLTGQLLDSETYVGLLFVFAVGGILFLWHDAKLRGVEASAKAVPGALFFFTWKLIGLLLASFALLSLILSIVIETIQVQSLVMHVTVLAYGLVLSWFTQMNRTVRPSVTTRTLAAPQAPAMALKAKKPVAKAAKKKKK